MVVDPTKPFSQAHARPCNTLATGESGRCQTHQMGANPTSQSTPMRVPLYIITSNPSNISVPKLVQLDH